MEAARLPHPLLCAGTASWELGAASGMRDTKSPLLAQDKGMPFGKLRSSPALERVNGK